MNMPMSAPHRPQTGAGAEAAQPRLAGAVLVEWVFVEAVDEARG